VHETIQALRASEIRLVLNTLGDFAWADPRRLVLSGASEGGPAVARYAGPDFAGRMVFSWSCEDNYFVDAHRTVVPSEPVLNVISASDPFFSRANAYIGNGDVQGHCGAALREHKNTTIVPIPGAPHTLLKHAAGAPRSRSLATFDRRRGRDKATSARRAGRRFALRTASRPVRAPFQSPHELSSDEDGMVSPSVLAVFRLMTSRERRDD